MCLAVPAGVQAQRGAVDIAASLARFYPTPLVSQPYAEEDHAVWMAKVRGLFQGAPSVLQQSLLSAQSADEFAGTLGLLEQMQEARIKRFAVESRTGSQRVGDGRVRTKTLGGNDLTYRPVAPCRLVDSRKNRAAMPNPLLGNTAYNFKIYTATNFDTWGGSSTSNCGIPNTSSIDAVALVVSVLEEPSLGRPNFSAYLGINDSSSVPTILGNVAVNFTQFRGISTTYVARAFSVADLYMALPASVQANVTIDIVGYFISSQATPIDCVNTAPTSQLIANGGGVQVTAPACPTGYTLTSTFCRLTSFTPNVFLLAAGPDVGTGNARCSWLNQSGGNVTAETEARCCRVPGGTD
jgi:hypothetical protein